MADETPMTPEEYQAKITAELKQIGQFRRALEEEWEDANADDPEVARKARDNVVSLVPQAGETIASLLAHAESESVRASLAKFVFNVAMQVTAKGEDDELGKFLKKLTDPVEAGGE